MSALKEEDLAALSALLGPGKLRQGQAAQQLDRGIHPDNLKAELVVLPQSTDEVSRLLALCHQRRLAVVPQGGRSGLAAAATSKPGDVILALQAMNRIEDIDAEGGTAIVEAGVTLGALELALAPLGWSAGIDLGARGSCTIGGMVSTNAGGMEAFRFGTMRQRVLGLEVVLPDGGVMRELTRVIKANNGYDIKQLFIGAEGTLGVVTRVALKLVPQRRPSATALIACASAGAAVKLTKQLERLHGASAERIEVMWRNHFDITAADQKLERLATLAPSLLVLVVEIAAGDAQSAEAALEATLGQALEEGLAEDAFIAKNEEERRQFWLVREDWAVDRHFPGGLWYDISVPPSKLAAYTERLTQRVKERDPSWQTFFIGHLADGNLHVTVNSPKPLLGHYEEVSKLVYDGLAAVGGSFSAEHGIGLEKKAALAKQGDPVKLSLMRAIKRAFDPLNIMNPGKVIDV